MPELRDDASYVTRNGLMLTGFSRRPCPHGFPIRARLMDRKGRVREEWYTDDGRWSAGLWSRSELDLVEVPPSERRA